MNNKRVIVLSEHAPVGRPHRISREKMIESLKGQGVKSARVLKAMGAVPREKFLPKALVNEAYDVSALPIGDGQTISQPFVVARMTELLDIHPTHDVLEIGTGSGYQTAVLCLLARRVFTIERIERLAKIGQGNLSSVGFSNFVPYVGDGTLGWPKTLREQGFDRIIITAAAPKIPQPLLWQLNVGGVLVLPLDEAGSEQQRLIRITRTEPEKFSTEPFERVNFVPLVGQEGHKIAVRKL